MGYRITEIEGIGKSHGAKLQKAGIATTTTLLAEASTPKRRKTLSEKSGLTEKQILKFANLADLMRIKGIGTQYSELLEASGVDTVKELKTRRPDNLAAKMKEVNEKKKLTRTVPTETRITHWVDEAKTLKPALKY
ncbi:MAG: DUF4332 domain-containing protein [Geminicoccaceae bacterium]